MKTIKYKFDNFVLWKFIFSKGESKPYNFDQVSSGLEWPKDIKVNDPLIIPMNSISIYLDTPFESWMDDKLYCIRHNEVVDRLRIETWNNCKVTSTKDDGYYFCLLPKDIPPVFYRRTMITKDEYKHDPNQHWLVICEPEPNIINVTEPIDLTNISPTTKIVKLWKISD